MRFAQLLDYGPRLIAKEQTPTALATSKKRYSPRLIEKYKECSINGQIASPIVSKACGIDINTAAKNLRQMCEHKILREVGRYKESKSYIKPYVYEWVENA